MIASAVLSILSSLTNLSRKKLGDSPKLLADKAGEEREDDAMEMAKLFPAAMTEDSMLLRSSSRISLDLFVAAEISGEQKISQYIEHLFCSGCQGFAVHERVEKQFSFFSCHGFAENRCIDTAG